MAFRESEKRPDAKPNNRYRIDSGHHPMRELDQCGGCHLAGEHLPVACGPMGSAAIARKRYTNVGAPQNHWQVVGEHRPGIAAKTFIHCVSSRFNQATRRIAATLQTSVIRPSIAIATAS